MATNTRRHSDGALEAPLFPIGRVLRVSFGMIAGIIAGLALAITFSP